MLLDKSGVKPLWQLCFLVFFLLVVGSATYARNLDYRTAKAFYQAELRKFPELPRLRLNLAIIHNREGEYREGFSLLRGLVRDYPNDVTILQNWYVFWSIVAKDRARAQTVLARILDLVESGRYSRKLDAPAIRNLALQLKKEGNYRGAIQFLDVLLRDYPKMDSLWVLRGRCFGRLDRWEAARESFERASAFAPQDPAIQFWLGKSHLETGAAQKGCQFLQRAALTPFRQDVAEKSKNLFQERCSGK
jgi:tetratricopeptide (TPR) repeat protein